MTARLHSVVVATIACVAFSLAVCFFFYSNFSDYASEKIDEAYKLGYDTGKSEVVVVEDEQVHTMPLFLQKDLRWYGVQYGDGCIGTHGCGLTAAAMATTYITGELVTPEYLANASGNEFITDGVNDPDKICKWLSEKYGMVYSGEAWTLDEGLALVESGYCVLASMSGQLGERSYGGHVILIYGRFGTDYLVRDPDDGENSIRSFSREELSLAKWTSFNGIK